jgi:WD40 repeat protein
VQLWDAQTGAQLASFVPPDFDEYVTGLAWTVDGQHLAVAGGDIDSSSVVVVDRTGAVLARFREEPEVYLRETMFSPDGTVLAIPRRPLRHATPSQQGLWLWDWRAGEMVGRIETQVLDVDWDPAGRRLVTVAELESRLDVWDARTLERISTVTGTSAFTDVRFSPDGAQVATSGTDGDVNLWNLENGAPTRLRGHEVYVAAVGFSGDGRQLVSVDADGVMRTWAVDVDDLVALAEQRLTRGLTDVECRRFLHRDTC